MGKLDYIIIALILLILLISFIFVYLPDGGPGHWVVVEVDGEEKERLALNKIYSSSIITIEGYNGESIVEIEKDRVRMKQSECPDGICVAQGWISHPGHVIACVPNHVVIRIIDKE